MSSLFLLLPKVFLPSETEVPSTAYSNVWILVRSDNTNTRHLKQFGIKKHCLFVDSLLIAVMIRSNAKVCVYQEVFMEFTEQLRL